MELVLRNELIVENILSHISSNDLLKAKLINSIFNCFGKKEIQRRGDHVIHLANDDEMNKFMEVLEKNYPDLDQWSPYSFKIPIGDIDRNLLDKFVALIGSHIKILDLYESYDDALTRNPQLRDRRIRMESRDRTDFRNTYAVERGLPYAEFLIATRTMPKIWYLLMHTSASLVELSLSLSTEFILISGRFPEQLPCFDRLKKLKLKYGENKFRQYYRLNESEYGDWNWNHIENGHGDDKLFKNIAEKAKNMTNGHIITPHHGHSRILTEIGSIKFANGGKPTLETKVSLSHFQVPFIEKLIQQEYFNQVNVLEVRLTKYLVTPQVNPRTREFHFKELLTTLHDFIMNQSNFLRILSIEIHDDSAMVVYPNFTSARPLQPFSKLEVLELKPNFGQKYRLLKEFCKGDFPILKEFYPFYDIEDVTYFEAPNVTMPRELLEKIRKSFHREVKKRQY